MTWANAFSATKLRMASCFFRKPGRVWEMLKWHLKLWKVFLLGINPVWPGCRSFPIEALSLLVNVLARIFCIVFSNDIEWYEPTSSKSFPFFGSKVIHPLCMSWHKVYKSRVPAVPQTTCISHCLTHLGLGFCNSLVI